MIILNIGGPINSGKSTVSKILATRLPNSVFIEVDNLVLDEEDQKVERAARWAGRLHCLCKLLSKHIAENKYDYVIFAYPMADAGYNKITKVAGDKARFMVITLNPSMEKCLTNRGNRELTEWELGRIPQMYNEGINTFHKSDLILDNSNDTPEQTADKVIDFVKGL